jgi:hypothetical protein
LNFQQRVPLESQYRGSGCSSLPLNHLAPCQSQNFKGIVKGVLPNWRVHLTSSLIFSKDQTGTPGGSEVMTIFSVFVKELSSGGSVRFETGCEPGVAHPTMPSRKTKRGMNWIVTRNIFKVVLSLVWAGSSTP